MAMVGKLRALLCVAILFVAPGALGNGNSIYFDCPCNISRDGNTLTFTAGFRSFRTTDSGSLRVLAFAVESQDSDNYSEAGIGSIPIAEPVPAGGILQSASHDGDYNQPNVEGVRYVRLVLEEQQGTSWSYQDQLRMEFPVDPGEAFSVDELDFLKDTDGDGVGDLNEQLEDTDPDDPESVPGLSTIDILVFYNQDIIELYDGDPTTRIQHLFALSNSILEDSELQVRFRLIGLIEVQLDDKYGNIIDKEILWQEAERLGADLKVLFRLNRPNEGTCGSAGLGGRKTRGYFSFRRESNNFATVIGNCGARVLTHELGHVMGLGHSLWQNSAGTWRWSRGYDVANDFYTMMSYGRGGLNIDVFSSPDSTCSGFLGTDKPCGVERNETEGADASKSIDVVRFQIAAFGESQPDTDGDGYVDLVDDLPLDAEEWRDFDGDGLGNNGDPDDDNDGVNDDLDVFPFDNTESQDSDGDGLGDNADVFPEDTTETYDFDGDGVGDNADLFPRDPDETTDADGDGVGDNGDAYPDDPSESADTDGDGVADNADTDDDADGIADVYDAYRLDPEKSDLLSWKFIGEDAGDHAGASMSAVADINGDGQVEFLIGAPDRDVDGSQDVGAAYLIAVADLSVIDAADGQADRVVDLGLVHTAPGSWKLVGESAWDRAGLALSAGDVNGDGQSEVIVAAPGHQPSGDWGSGAVYIISNTDLGTADAADGVSDGVVNLGNVASGESSWKLTGANLSNRGLGRSVSAGDVDGDELADLLIGAPYSLDSGSSYLVFSVDLGAFDEADGNADGVVYIGGAVSASGIKRLSGETSNDSAGISVSLTGDLDGDGRADLVIGASQHGDKNNGAVYIISANDLAGADELDGSEDGNIELLRVREMPASWVVKGSLAYERVGISVDTAGDLDGDMMSDLVIGSASFGYTYVVSSTDLPLADAADGASDHLIHTDRIARQSGSWKFIQSNHGFGKSVSLGGDLDGDGLADLLIGGEWRIKTSGAYAITAADLMAIREIEKDSDAVINLLSPSALAPWTLVGPAHLDRAGYSVTFAGDVEGDGLSDIAVSAIGDDQGGENAGAVYLILAAELPVLDDVDAKSDRRVALADLIGDTDGDGIGNATDHDDDNDGVADVNDLFQLDGTEWTDSDGDGYGDNSDAFPFDGYEQFDTDEDGIGDKDDLDDDNDGVVDYLDPHPLDTDDDGLVNSVDEDADNDGVVNNIDAFPYDALETIDSDADGIGNNSDADDDNDGVADDTDVFPLDPLETVDTDGDGIGDYGDAFPQNSDETLDTDNDGIGNNADTDDDNDGVPDTEDDLPLNPDASVDSDSDGVSDDDDTFPDDPLESVDTDSDGIGDNADGDDDNDGIEDEEDLFPLDSSRWSLTSVKFVPDEAEDMLQSSVAALGDVDGDGQPEILIAALDRDVGGAYLVSVQDVANADEADGVLDGVVKWANIPSQEHSWKLAGEVGYRTGYAVAPTGDLDGDGVPEFAVGSIAMHGAVYLLSGVDLLAADAADGEADSVVGLGAATEQAQSWKLIGRRHSGTGKSVSIYGDMNGDGIADVAVGEYWVGAGDSPGTVHLVSGAAFPTFDALDGNINGIISLGALSSMDGYWRFEGELTGDGAGTAIAAADFDGDGKPDLVIGAPTHDVRQQDDGAVYLVGSKDFAALDSADGTSDRRIELGRAAAEQYSWKFINETSNYKIGRNLATGDVNGDGQPDLIFFYGESVESGESAVVVDVLSGTMSDLAGIDAADGSSDSVIDLGQAGSVSGTWKLTGNERFSNIFNGLVASADVDADGFRIYFSASRHRLISYLR